MPQSVLLWQPVLRVNGQTTHLNVSHLPAVYRSFLPQLRAWQPTAHGPSTALPPVLRVVWWASSCTPWSMSDSAHAQVCAQNSVVATQTTRPAKQSTSSIQPCTRRVCRPQDWTVSSWKKGTASSASKPMSSTGQDSSWSCCRKWMRPFLQVSTVPGIFSPLLLSAVISSNRIQTMDTQLMTPI